MRRHVILLYKVHKDRKVQSELLVAQVNMDEKVVQGKMVGRGHKVTEGMRVRKGRVDRREKGASKGPRAAKEILEDTVHKGCVESEGSRD